MCYSFLVVKKRRKNRLIKETIMIFEIMAVIVISTCIFSMGRGSSRGNSSNNESDGQDKINARLRRFENSTRGYQNCTSEEEDDWDDEIRERIKNGEDV